MNTQLIFIGLLLFNLHLLAIKKKTVRRFFTYTDISYFILVLSFLLNNNYLYPIAITLCFSVLIGKTFILKHYSISSTDDFVTHYLNVLVAICLLFNRKNYKYNIVYLLAIMLLLVGINYSYKYLSNKNVYKKINYDNIGGKIKLLGHIIITLLIYKAIQL